MEGHLRKWTNFMGGWKTRYLILENDILLTYYQDKGGKKLGQIHVQLASIYLSDKDQLNFKIIQGDQKLNLKAETLQEKNKWIDAFKKANKNIIKQQEEEQISIDKIQESPSKESQSEVQKQINDLMASNKLLDEKVKIMVPKVQKKTKKLEQELIDLQEIAILQKQLINNIEKYYLEEKNKKIKQFESSESEISSENSKQYYSFNDDESIMKQNSTLQIIDNIDNIDNKQNIVCPIKQNLTTTNKVYLSTQISQDLFRDELPIKKDPNFKINVWQILKEAVGKDLSQISMPVILNEPISMLQRLGEEVQYYDLLNIANNQSCSLMRMAYVLAFSFSVASMVINRTLKPFNPILGETFELIRDDLRFIGEQVSHHPPVSACYCYNENFKFWMNSNIVTKFWGKSLEINPLGCKHIKLLKYNDHIVYEAPKTGVYNIIFGKVYVDFQGQQIHKNYTTDEIGVLNYTQRGWGDKNAYETDGYIQDNQGKKRYLLKGKWNSHLNLINVETQETIKLWQKTEVPAENSEYYNMSNWAMNLNHLSQQLLNQIPATDSRLRPDQRALEYGDINLASEEKKRFDIQMKTGIEIETEEEIK